MDEETKAQRLAAWLDSPAGTDPPEDLDPEVLGAVWALVPDRAPAPRVSIDDIFSLVTEGPFAQGAAPASGAPTAGEVVRFPGNVGDDASGEWGAEDLTHVVPTAPVRLVAHPGGKTEPGTDASAPAPTSARVPPVVVAPVERAPSAVRKAGGPSRGGPSRAWMLPTIGLALAAAAATLIVVPRMGELSPASDPAALETARDLQSRPASRAIPELADEGGPPSAEPAPDGTSQAQAPAASPATASSPAPAASGLPSAPRPDVARSAAPEETPGASAEKAGDVTRDLQTLGYTAEEAPARKQAPPPPPALAEMETDMPAAGAKAEQVPVSSSSAPSQGYGAGGAPAAQSPAPVVTAPTPATGTTSSRGRSQRVETDKSKTYIPETAGPSAPREAADDSLLDGGAYDMEEDEASAPRVESAKKDRAGKGASKPSAPTSSKSAETLSEASDFDEVATSAPGASASNVLTLSARDSAWPGDYDAGWYRALPDVAPTFDAARADEAAGRFEDALARYRTLATDARATVSQDASLRAAKALKALGRNREALAAADAGLNRSGANTPFRASLYALRGDLLVLLGRAGEAEAAWASAATLNESR